MREQNMTVVKDKGHICHDIYSLYLVFFIVMCEAAFKSFKCAGEKLMFVIHSP